MKCARCGEHEDGVLSRDLADRISPERYREGFAATAICINCGLIFVDPEGYRVERSQDTGKWQRFWIPKKK